MGDVINLRRARKAKLRREGAQTAAQARALHGRTKAERAVIEAEKDRFTRHVDQSRREVETPASEAVQSTAPEPNKAP